MMSENDSSGEKAPWITYRPELKVLDCTVRDGGLINDHQFTDEFVRAVYDTCIAAGVDTMEIGYKELGAAISEGPIRRVASLQRRGHSAHRRRP